MKHKRTKRIFSILTVLVMVIGLIPAVSLPAAAGHPCPGCDEWIDGSPYCGECWTCDNCCDLCIDCGRCTDCSGNEICNGCSDEGIGDSTCTECALDQGAHCPYCDTCYMETLVWCEECGQCEACIEMCDACSVNLGHGTLCIECAQEGEGHCPECGGCYFEIQGWCEECMQCRNCVPICDYCSTEEGMVLCEECAISEGMHCPECNECYGDANGDQCMDCGVCGTCVEFCSEHELCVSCAIDQGLHCGGCEACGESAILCEECGEHCSECSDAVCENCNLCSNCVTICPECGSCENCAEICENCGEYCTNCEDFCDDCGLCLICCEYNANYEGCDCFDWICIESTDWYDHYNENHIEDEGSHAAHPLHEWSWNLSYHWHDCAFCDEPTHQSNKNTHSFDAYDTCTVCNYVKGSKILILEQPRSSTGTVTVPSPDEAYDEKNIARFSVKAKGNSELTYTWCRRYYVGGVPTYKPLSELFDPTEDECYDPELKLIAPTDSCCDPLYLICIISDEEGNEVRTTEVMLQARHNYQYYALWKTDRAYPLPGVARGYYGHILACAGECPEEKVSGLRPHEDEDGDWLCDVCDYEISGILITKQPRNVTNVYVHGVDETYDESNIAHFTVEAVADTELTYTWCRRYYSKGRPVYAPLTNPEEGECYDGPTLSLLVPRDSCTNTYYYSCFITDEEGNEVQTVDVMLKAKHNYQYFKDYLSSRENPYLNEKGRPLKRKTNGHFLVCVGENCGKYSRLKEHVDSDNDFGCDVCDLIKPISTVSIHVTPPLEGQKPNYTVSCDSPAYAPMGDSSDYGLYRFWLVSNDGESGWSIMDKNDTFTAGKFYKFSVDLYARQGRTFATYNYTEPIYAPFVNGNYDYYAGNKTYNKDAALYTTIEHNFGQCNDSTIETITIDGVTLPVAGEKPTYTATVRGSGYQINAAKNAYYDAYWAGEKWYYIKNGIGWYDRTESDWVYENETFIPGHEYQINLYLITEDGYEFAHSKYYDPAVTAAVNGYSAESLTTGSDCVRNQQVTCTFQCQPREISTVMIYDLDAPQAGKLPDYDATVAYPEYYQIDPLYAGSNGIVWYDEEGMMLDPSEKFAEGVKYQAEIKIIPAQLNGANVCQFSKNTAVYLNGVLVDTSQNGNDVYPSQNSVYLYHTFPNGASAPEPGKALKGSVNGKGGAATTLQLFAKNVVTPAYETTVYGSAYTFADVPAGTYTLKATRHGHLTRTYTVKVGKWRDAELNVELYALGDTNQNDVVDTADVSALLQTLAGHTTPAYYEIADFDQNGTITVSDAVLILRSLAG